MMDGLELIFLEEKFGAMNLHIQSKKKSRTYEFSDGSSFHILRYGKLPWARLFKDAISIAKDGFIANDLVHQRLTVKMTISIQPIFTNYFLYIYIYI